MNSGLLCFALPCLIVTIYFGGLYRKERQFGQRLRRDGQIASATIVERTTQVAGRGGTVDFVAYQYEVQAGGETIRQTQRQQVSGKVYQRLSEGARVPIRYLPDDPATSRLDGEYRDRGKETSPLILSGCFAVLSILFLAAALRGS